MVDAVLLTIRLALAGILALAGLAKLLDRAGTQRSLRGFGLPARLAPPLAVGLPAAELATAGLLLTAAGARAGALCAGALLAAFSAAIGVNLALGRRPSCHCFGKLHSAPVGAWTLVRNIALAGAAAVVAAAAGPGPSAVGWVSRLDGAEMVALSLALALGAAVALFGWAFLYLLRQHGRLLLRLDALNNRLAAAGIGDLPEPAPGLAVGTPAPGLDRLRPSDAGGRATVLVFTDGGCGACRELAPTVDRWREEHADVVAVVSVEDEELAAQYEVAGVPSAVLVDPEGRIASGLAQGAAAIEELVESVIAGEFGTNGHEPGLAVGTPAPDLELPALAGGSLKLADLRGEDVLLLFWNPSCGFCRAMLDDLLAWESRAAEGQPKLLVVSSGSAEETAANGFRSPVVLDESFEVAASFGAFGTPMAVLVDGEGRVASPLARGPDEVLALAGGRFRVAA